VRRPWLAAGLAIGAILGGLAIAWAIRERMAPAPAPRSLPRLAPPPAPACFVDAEDLAELRIHGGDARSAGLARGVALRLLATRVGAQAREILRSGVLPEPLTLELNERGDNYTPYRVPGRELGETIVFDPSARPFVDTEQGRRLATPETILAHELGHAVFKLRSEEDVIREIENPIRDELGLPRRRRF
jgi:hypothetical protein